MIPVQIISNIGFQLVLDYDGSNTGLIKVSFDPAVAGQGWVNLPANIFSADFLGKFDYHAALKEWKETNFPGTG